MPPSYNTCTCSSFALTLTTASSVHVHYMYSRVQKGERLRYYIVGGTNTKVLTEQWFRGKGEHSSFHFECTLLLENLIAAQENV